MLGASMPFGLYAMEWAMPEGFIVAGSSRTTWMPSTQEPNTSQGLPEASAARFGSIVLNHGLPDGSVRRSGSEAARAWAGPTELITNPSSLQSPFPGSVHESSPMAEWFVANSDTL